jgi:sugar O-acyltransferase (sialic acid O-acetyltransferase NeuD family)
VLSTDLFIVGAGGHGRSVAEAANLSGAFTVIGFWDDSLPVGEVVLGVPVIGAVHSIRDVSTSGVHVVVAIGNNLVREDLIHRLSSFGFCLATVIHPRAFVSPSAVVGYGSAIMAGAIVGTEARLGIGTIVNCGAVVDHHAVVEDFGHLGVNAGMAGGTVLGRCAWMQAGSALGYGVKVAPGETVRPCEGRTVVSHQERLDAA